MKRTASVPTPNAQRYMTQLSKHWAHKFEVVLDGSTSVIALPAGKVFLEASDSLLGLRIEAPAERDLDRLAEVVEQHIDRFAHREGGLAYNWLESAEPD